MDCLNLKDALLSCNDISDIIMDVISEKLSEIGKSFKYNNGNEIIVKNSTKDEIKSLIYDKISYNKKSLKLLVQINESNGNVFIRQKFC